MCYNRYIEYKGELSMSITKEERIILSAFTGVLLTKDQNSLLRYIENKLERSVYTHELVNPEIWQEIKEKARPDFLEIMNKEIDE